LELGKLGFLEVESGERGGLTLDFEEFEKPVLFLSLCFFLFSVLLLWFDKTKKQTNNIFFFLKKIPKEHQETLDNFG